MLLLELTSSIYHDLINVVSSVFEKIANFPVGSSLNIGPDSD
jgi:hypothetical protein